MNNPHGLFALVVTLVSLGSDTNPRKFLRDRKGQISERSTGCGVGGKSPGFSLGSKVGVLRPWEMEARKAFGPLKGLIEAYHASDVSEVHGLTKLGSQVEHVAFRHEVKALATPAGEIRLVLDGATIYTGGVEGACDMMGDLINGARPNQMQA